MIEIEDNLPEPEEFFDPKVKKEIQSKIKIDGRNSREDTTKHRRRGEKWYKAEKGVPCYCKVEDTFKPYGFPRGSETFETSQSKRSNEEIKNDFIYKNAIPKPTKNYQS